MLETKSIAALAFNFNENETPRKRKRETRTTTTTSASIVTVADPPLTDGKSGGQETGAAAANPSCFTNAAFSSTPKKIIGRRRLAKENNHPSVNSNPNPFPCLEVKSIVDLVQPTNPFEVVRQPSKKKKREHACFENPGLNLELPERQFNPYEVVRSVVTPSKGFVNAALNLRGNDTPASLNPFEIHRPSESSVLAANPTGVENPALAEDVVPTNLKIGLPFAPTLGCRIDFHGMSLSQLTPSKLLAEKLVFSPVPGPGSVPAKRSLGAISEESSTMDIGKELDRYQLELENSINEAKLRKNGILVESIEVKEQQLMVQDVTSGERRSIVCSTRRKTLTEINETPEETEQTEQEEITPLAPTVVLIEEPEEESKVAHVESGDVAYASESDEDIDDEQSDDLDFKAPPMRFVRSYRPAGVISEKLKANSKDSLTSITSSKSSKSSTEEKEGNQHHGHGHGMKSMIRKSIRRLIHPLSSNQDAEETPLPPPPPQSSQSSHTNIINTIRHSLRRRPHQKLNPSPQKESIADISIVDTSERTMKLRSIIPQTEYMPIEQLTNEKKHTLRNSIRRSTRDVLRHVFHKTHDAYATAK